MGHLLNTTILAGGSIAISANSVVTVATVTRQAGQVILTPHFVSENVNNLAFGEAGDLLNSVDNVMVGLQRTSTANEFAVKAKNSALGASRTLEYKIIAL